MQLARILLLLCCLTFTGASAQHLKLFRAIVTRADGSKMNGILYEVTDSTLRLALNIPDAIARLRAKNVPILSEIDSRDINRIIIRRRGHAWRGPVTGFGIGLGVGGLILVGVQPAGGGLDEAIGKLAVITTTASLPVIGTAIGLIGGVIPRRNIKIRQNPVTFREARSELRPFSVRGQKPKVIFTP